MRNRPPSTFTVLVAWVLLSSPGCTKPSAPFEPPGWWDEISMSLHAGDEEGSGEGDDWVDFSDGGDYADDFEDYHDDAY